MISLIWSINTTSKPIVTIRHSLLKLMIKSGEDNDSLKIHLTRNGMEMNTEVH